MPGAMSSGFDPRKLQLLEENGSQGVNSGEVAVLNLISQRIDESSVNKSYQGGEAPGSTLGEAQISQQQSGLIIDLAMTSCAILERKLGEKRVPMIMKYWFDPVDTKFDDVRKALVETYRISSIEASIPGKGMGRSMVIPQGGVLPNSEEVYDREKEDSRNANMPVRHYYLNPKLIKKADHIWQVTVNPTPRRGDSTAKLMLNATIQSAQAYFPQTFNSEYWQELFSETNSLNSSKAFNKSQPPQVAQPVPQAGMPKVSAKTNRINIGNSTQ